MSGNLLSDRSLVLVTTATQTNHPGHRFYSELSLYLCRPFTRYDTTLILSAKQRRRGIARHSKALTLSTHLKHQYLYYDMTGFAILSISDPFSYFIFTSFWQYKIYYVFGFMLLVFLIMSVVTVCVTIVCTYFLLNAEDYRW